MPTECFIETKIINNYDAAQTMSADSFIETKKKYIPFIGDDKMFLKNKKLKILIPACAVVFFALCIWILYGNTAVEVNTYTVTSDEIPEEFHGLRIAQVSDLHNTEIGEDNEKLLSLLVDAEPDIIAITGDLIDSRKTDIETAVSFAEKAVKIAPCYYVTGNHEVRTPPARRELKSRLGEAGVLIMDNKKLSLERGDSSITLVGLADPSYDAFLMNTDEETAAELRLQELMEGENGYTVLLSHRPELFSLYSESGADLTLSGHAHGGQIILPFLGGIFAPNQGFFPEYDGGLYKDGTAQMIVSRGIGNSAFPLRVNNRPELILVELQADIS